jgi:hypothetical protein
MSKKVFYKLWHPKNINQKYLAEWSGEDIKLESIISCPVNDGHQRTGRLNDLTIIIIDGNAFKYDVIWTWYSEPVINERVIKILKEEGLTGYILKPVTIKKIKKNKPEKIPLYQELNIVGKAGVHPDTELIVVGRCDACKHVDYRGWKNKLIIDEKKWDGSDFFHLDPYPGGIFVSERVKEVFEKHKVTGVEFTPSEECKDVWRIDETEREKWRKYWEDYFNQLSDEQKEEFRKEIIKEIDKGETVREVVYFPQIFVEKLLSEEERIKLNEVMIKREERIKKGKGKYKGKSC